MGHNSLPSGQSITIFTVITVSLFAFMPKGFFYKFLNITIVLFLGYTFAITRVGVGAHYPLDVLIGSVIGFDTDFDGVLLNGLKDQILSSKKNKILIVLHTSTSHGPTYNKKYSTSFEQFKPVCNCVELGNCSKEELINAYDNTIVYTDYLLNTIINDLLELKDFKSSMIFVSDHGESLGEKNLYMHGVPISMAPKEQFEIPFIVWTSENSKQYKPKQILTQNNVFHSVLNFLDIESPIYNESLNIFK